MIVRPHQHWFLSLFSWRGSVLPNIFSRLSLNFALSVSAVLLLPYYDSLGLHLTTAPFSLVGIAIAIFLGFRTNTSYARFNEARCLWGMLLITTRSISRQVQSILNDKADSLLAAQFLMAFSWSLKHQLRGTNAQTDLERLLPEPYLSEVLSSPLRTNRILLLLGEWLGQKYRAGQLSDIVWADIDKNLNEMAHIQGACERIANTPIPYAYGLILRRTVYLFCTILPFALVDDLRYLTPLISVFISYTFLSLEYVAEEIEEPFGTAPNDLALDAICTTIEINQLEMNDIRPLPSSMQPDPNYRLS
ncbi:bestrophin family protein [Fluviibacter phosphoraccumulans]|uniref:bestrophin family protein n=1 Tax=Fluviibacter phosphoraccumulans TaxID=1751046 RepID=UPI0024E23FA8|nr:bestrophin family ion channel [Fluviibacter phosphoraccumulans]